jgi:hypothetical protein
MTTRLLCLLLLATSACGARSQCEATCAGCCRNDVCLDGRSFSACGTNGALCDSCVGTQVCGTSGRCEQPSFGAASGGAGGGTSRPGGGTAQQTGGGTALQPMTLPLSAFDGGCAPVYENLLRCGLATAELAIERADAQCDLGQFLSSQECINSTWAKRPFPRVGPGGACTGDLECGETGFCEVKTCPGTCVQRKPVGARANRVEECELGLTVALQHCAVPDAQGLRCDASPNGCPVGTACVFVGTGLTQCRVLRTANQGEACDGATLCRGTLCRDGLCQPPLTEGASCSTSSHCQAGLTCDQGRCVKQYLCTFCSGRCITQNGVTQCLPFVARGGVCATNQDCGQTDFCDSNNECALKRPAGAACGVSSQCQAGLTCNSSNVCARPVTNRPAGSYCEADSECASGQCFGSAFQARCLAIAPLGSACGLSRSIDCHDGAYCDDATGTCRALRGGGEACTTSSACMSYSCESGVCTYPRGDWCTVAR